MPTDTKTDYIDEWLSTHLSYLPGDIIDFALDVRRMIAELEEELAAMEETGSDEPEDEAGREPAEGAAG